MKCIIIEDQPPAQRILQKYITDLGTIELVDTFNNAIEALDFLKDIIIIVIIVLLIRTFFMMPFKINGQSMYASYYDKEFIIVDRFSYREFPVIGQHREIQRGDVIVFAPGVSEERKYFIKRVIGLP